MAIHSHNTPHGDATASAGHAEHGQSHGHDAPHGHSHGHNHHGHNHHGHHHGHKHSGKEDSNKFMTGDRYWRWPGLRETALKTSSSVVNALKELGIDADEMKKLDVLEIGCGGGAVTRRLAPTFSTISAIDIEPTMITSLHSRLSPSLFASDSATSSSSAEGTGNVTAFVHTITSQSPASFASGDSQPSPTSSDPARTVKPHTSHFDVAVIINVLHHVENPVEFFAGLSGLLKQGGKVVVIEPNGLETVPPTGMHVKAEAEEGYEELSEAELEAMKSHGHSHSHFFTVEKLSSAFEERGYKTLLATEDGTMPAQGVGRPEMKVGVLVAQKQVL